MKFNVEKMMAYAIVMAKDNGEYERFGNRMTTAGFKVPPLYIGQYPKVLFGGAVNVCALNHFVFVNMAKTLGWPHVTIFESDAYPMRNCAVELDKFFSQYGVPDDAELITFGNLHWIRDWTNGGDTDHRLSDIQGGYGRHVGELWGAHAVTVFSRGYDKWLKSYIDRKTMINADSFVKLADKCYSPFRSFFLQKKDTVQYLDWIVDKQYLIDFPENL
jgi:hypothetical protein